MKRLCIPAIVALAVLPSPPANAYKEWVSNLTIERVLSNTDGSWGNCMVYVSAPAPNADCPSRWFHFSCDGSYVTPDVGRQNFNVAYAAFLADKRVNLYVDDTKKDSSYCFVQRIDVFR